MAEARRHAAQRGPGPIKIALWMGACVLLLAPWVAMQFTREMMWTPSDFIVFGIMLFGALGLYELVARRGGGVYRWATGVAVTTAFFLVWINLAVGIVGSESNPANLMFAGVLAVGLLGACVARFRPAGMAYALFATALAQLVAGIVALAAGLGTDGIGWPRDVIGLTAIFTILWLASATLFQRAARQEMAA